MSRCKADESVSYGPAQWARRSFTKGFAGADFALQPDGTLRCPADHPLYPQERRAERDGSVRVLYAARIGHCRSCPLRAQCQENGTTSKPRRVSAVFWPLTSTTSPPDEPLPEQPAPSRPVLWGDWERCHLRRHWFHLLRTQTVLLTFGPVQHVVARGCSPTGCANPSPTSPLAAQLGATSRSQCSPPYHPTT